MNPEPFPRTAALCDKWERISQQPGSLSMKELETTVKQLVADLVASHLQLERELTEKQAMPTPAKETREQIRQRFEAWHKVAYPLFNPNRDTTMKHQLWTAWQVANG